MLVAELEGQANQDILRVNSTTPTQRSGPIRLSMLLRSHANPLYRTVETKTPPLTIAAG